MRGYAERMMRYRMVVLVAAVLVTLVLGAQLRELRIVVDPDEILPQAHPLQIATNTVSRIFGNKYVVVVAISARHGTVFQPAVLGRVKAATDALLVAPGVVTGNVLSLAAPRVKSIRGSADGLEVRPLMAQVPTTAAGLAALKALYEANPVYHGLLVSDDLRTAAIIAEFHKDPAGFRKVVERVHRIVDPLRGPEVEILIGGQPVLVGMIERFSDRMAIFFPAAMLIIGLIHWEAFRSLQAMVLPLLTAILAVIWSLGIISWAGATLDAFNVTTPILILAVAAGHAVQILKRYYESYAVLRRDGVEPRLASRRAVIDSLAGVGLVMIAAGVIAGVSFLSLVIFDIRSIQVFGLFTALGIASAVVIELTFTPALRAVLPPPSDAVVSRENRSTGWDGMLRRLGTVVMARPRSVLAVGGVLTALLGAAAVHVRVDNATRAYFFPGLPEVVADRAINRRLAGTNTLYVLVQGKRDGAIKDPRVLQAMAKTQRFLQAEPQIGKTVSIVDFLAQIDRAFADDDPAPFGLPRTADLIAQYLLLYSMAGDSGDFDHYVDYPYRTAVITGFIREESSTYLLDLRRRLAAFAATVFPKDVRVSIGGTVMEPVALNDVIVSRKLLNIAQIAVCVFLVSALLFRSLMAGLLVLVPLAATVVTVFGIMGAAAIPLQVVTATVSALAVGVGADYAIYFLYRVREAHRATGDLAEAMRTAFVSAGKAVAFVATAVAGGYAVLIASWGFLIHIWLGLLMSAAMIVSAASVLTVMAALVVLTRPRFLFARDLRAKLSGAVLLATLTVAACGGSAYAQAPSVEAIMKRNFMVGKVDDSVSTATLTLINASGQQRVRKTVTRTKLKPDGVDNMRIVRFLSPPDVRGTATLTIENADGDDDIWIYLPALRKTRRLLASQKKDSYVGTDLSYGDIIGFKVAEWRHSLVRREKLNGVDCYVIASVPATETVQENSGYSKRLQWIRTDNFVTEKGEFYDTNGKLLKTIISTDIRQVDSAKDRWQTMHIEARNVQTGHSTTVQFENFKANLGLSAREFNARELEHQ